MDLARQLLICDWRCSQGRFCTNLRKMVPFLHLGFAGKGREEVAAAQPWTPAQVKAGKFTGSWQHPGCQKSWNWVGSWALGWKGP